MNPIFLLRELNILKGNKTVLDVGTKDGTFANRFADLGFNVDAIDIHEPENPLENVTFKKIGVEDFLSTQTKAYDIVVCRHVLHHLNNPKEIITKLNNISKIFFFTCFGPKDDWASKVSTLSHEEVLAMFELKTVYHHSEAFQYGKTYTGEIKFWHINTFVIKNY